MTELKDSRFTISIHALREEGDIGSGEVLAPTPNFYPRPPRGGRPRGSRRNNKMGDFYPRPPRGGRRQYTLIVVLYPQFLSTPSARRATPQIKMGGNETIFLSTPSARRATAVAPANVLAETYFYPRPPRGGRRRPLRLHPPHTHISIHALREEGDQSGAGRKKTAPDFYPRPPRGGRLGGQSAPIMQGLFLSTPSARRATIPATSPCTSTGDFYPRPPRGGRLTTLNYPKIIEKFLSTPSARRATLMAIRVPPRYSDFYPRPPRGGRPLTINIPAGSYQFLSTPSARRATT